MRSCVTEAGCASNATRLPRNPLRSAREASKRSKPNFIEHSRRATRRIPRRRESRGCPAGAAARSSSSRPRGPRRRPSSPRATAMVRRRASRSCHAGRHTQLAPRLRDRDLRRARKRERPHALPIAVELIRRPFRRWREIELAVASAGAGCDERFEARVLPKPRGALRRCAARNRELAQARRSNGTRTAACSQARARRWR